MDWRVFLTTFGVIFLAEMGDKTQLAAMTMSAQSKKALGCVHRGRPGANGRVSNWSAGRKPAWQLPSGPLDQARCRSGIHSYRDIDSGREVLRRTTDNFHYPRLC